LTSRKDEGSSRVVDTTGWIFEQGLGREGRKTGIGIGIGGHVGTPTRLRKNREDWVHDTPAMSLGYMVTPKKAKIEGRKRKSHVGDLVVHTAMLCNTAMLRNTAMLYDTAMLRNTAILRIPTR